MKKLVVFYTRTGANRILAEAAHKKLRSDIEEIKDTKERGMVGCAMAAFFRSRTRIAPIKKDPSGYDMIVITTPVWAGTFPPAARTYIIENRDKLKSVSILSACGSGEGKKIVKEAESLLGNKLKASLFMKEEDARKRNFRKSLDGFTKKLKK